MKKILLFMILLGLLAGCGVNIKPETMEADEAVLNVAEQCAKSFTDALAYSLSDGLKIVDYSSDKPSLSNDAVYQFYRGETLKYLFLQEEKISIIEVSDQLAEALKQECAFVRINGSLILVSEEEEIALEEGKVITEDMKEKIKKLRSKGIRISLPAIKRKNLEFRIDTPDAQTVSDNGIEYNAGRIIVKFMEGDSEKFIEDYSEFCGGKLLYSMKLAKLYVFEFENRTLEELKELQEKSEALDYVVSASLDGINELN